MSKFTTIGQWYWGGAVEVAGEFPDLSKRVMFEPYLGLSARVPRGAVRTGDEYQPGRSGEGALATARLAHCRSSPGCAHTADVPSVPDERACRVYGHQGCGCSLANRLVKRSGRGVSCTGAAGDHGRHRRNWVSSTRQRISFHPEHRPSGSGGERSAARLAETIEAGASVRRGGFRFCKKSQEDSWHVGVILCEAGGSEVWSKNPADSPSGLCGGILESAAFRSG